MEHITKSYERWGASWGGLGGGPSFYLSAAILHHQSSSPISVPRLKDTSGSLVSSEEDSHLSMCFFFCLFFTKVEWKRVHVGKKERKTEKKKIWRGSNLFFSESISLGTNLAPFGLPVQVSSLGLTVSSVCEAAALCSTSIHWTFPAEYLSSPAWPAPPLSILFKDTGCGRRSLITSWDNPAPL